MSVIGYERLPVDSQCRLDAVCLHFEEAWVRSERPGLPAYLAGAPFGERAVWLTELLYVELECRRRAGESPDPAEYHELLPHDTGAINAVFAGAAADAVGVGSTVGKYRLTRLIGRGGMNSVYEADDPVIGRPVAVKLLTGRADAARATEEARLAGRLAHPNIVTIYEAGCDAGVWYMAMERLSLSAAERVKQAGPFDPRAATRIAADVCRGLAAAHRAGLIHRDIKPANVLLTEAEATGSRVAKLSDFGLAHEVGASRTSGAAGTPAFMPPEALAGRPAGPAGDIYSLGATYYTLLTGRPPYEAGTAAELMAAHRDAPVPDPRVIGSEVPAAAARIVARAMAKDPARRYPNAGAMLAELEAVRARPPRRPVSRRRARIAAGAFALLSLAALVALLWPDPMFPPPPRSEEPEVGWADLFNGRDLTGWEPLVKGGQPGKDPNQVFSVVNKDGQPMIRVSGAHPGALTTLGEHENYHLQLEYCWDAANGPHHSGLLYHTTSPSGRSSAELMRSHGLDVTPLKTGSYLPLANHHGGNVSERHDGQLESINPDRPRTREWQNREHPTGRWNRVELVCVGDTALHAVNGSLVLVLAQSRQSTRSGEMPLTRGRIQLRSSQGAIDFRQIRIRPVTKTPARFQRMVTGTE